MTRKEPSDIGNRPHSLSELIENVRIAWLLLRDKRINILLRYGLPLLVAVYVLFPIDFLPDVIPGLGQIDDLAALWLSLLFLLKMAPAEIVDEHRAHLRQSPSETILDDVDEDQVIDGAYKVVE